MTTNWQQPPGGPPPQPNKNPQGSYNQNKGKRFALVAVLLVVIAGLAAGAGLFMANRDVDVTGDEARYVVTETVATDPVFEPRDARGADPFFPLEVQLLAFQEEQEDEILEEAEALLEGAEPGQQVSVPEFDVAALDEAVKTGLYGGTEENTCDPERLISFLYANPPIAAAWAGVQGIPVADIAEYIRGLDVRVLAEPVAVLNHGFDFATNAPYEVDTVLEAGTAVLVDKNGDIRTRCYCGNPIKPKPPEHMPPRCVVYLEHVYVAPGGGERRSDALRDVLLTGRESIVGGVTWVEVKWGNNDDERGWVRSDNLGKHYCPPEQAEWQCPGPGAVPVWEFPDDTNQVGWHTGTLATTAGNVDIFGPVEPVGGLNPVISNGFMMINFTQASGPQNSAWVRLSDLDQDEENCFRIPMCIDTNGPVWERVGGGIDSPGGIMRVEFTGRFVVDMPITHTEVRLIEEDGRSGWITKFYTPLADEECDTTVEYECVTDYDGFATSVYAESTGPETIGYVHNAIVTVLLPRQDGRVRIEMATPGGPIGWIDEAALTADIASCVPVYDCYRTTGPAFAEYPTNGAMIGAIAVPQQIGVVGKHVHATPGDPVDYQRIEVPGMGRFWIDINDLIPVAPEDCDEITECPAYGDLETTRDDDDVRPDRTDTTECCVAILYESPDTSSPVMNIPFPATVPVAGTITVDNLGVEEVWFITDTVPNYYFMAGHVLPGFDCVADCPTPVDIPGLDDALRMELPTELMSARVSEPLTILPDPTPDADCCISAAYTDIESGIEVPGDYPRLVEVESGPHAPAPGWYMTTDGDWFRADQVLPASACEPIECPTPETPGTYDLAAIKRGDDETTLALTWQYPGDTAECCAEGTLYSSASFDEATGGELSEPTTVIVVAIDGEWYQVQVDGMIVWIHESQFVDIGDCDGDNTPCDALPTPYTTNEFAEIVSCCIQGRALNVHPADAEPGDFFSVDPAVEGMLFEIVDDLATGPWYGFNTVEHGQIWVTADFIVDASACDTDVECLGESFVDTVAVGGEELLQCCVAFTSSAGAPGFKVVTLTGETVVIAGVTMYVTTEGETFIEADFVSADNCVDVPGFLCPDGVTVVEITADCPAPVLRCENGQIVTSLSDCPAPVLRCENGQIVTSLSDCPPTTFVCPDGVTVVADLNRCPAPPESCLDTDSDGWCDEADNCVFNANPGQEDNDNDGRGNPCDDCPSGDRDGDRICDDQDNCPDTRNNNQRNRDGDGVGDACDNCPDVTNGFQFDDDGDGIGNECDQPDCPTGQTTSTGECCPTGTTAGSVDCFCADGNVKVPGQDCGAIGVLVLPEGCPSDRLRGDGVCCPPGSIAWQTNLSAATVWSCLEPEG